MDQRDREIINYLEEYGRASYTRIAEELGVSEGTVRNRVQNLKENNVIKGFTVQVNREAEIEAFVTVNVNTEQDFQQIIQELPEDSEFYELAGDIDIIVKIRAENSANINAKVDKIRAIEGVNSSKTYIVLSKN